MSQHTPYMQQALEKAREALPEDVPVGAVIVHEDEVIAAACNRREADTDPTAHAEMRVLQAAARMLGDWRLTDVTLYVTLEPCPMCAAAIRQARIPVVVFGAYDSLMGACGSALNLLSSSPASGTTDTTVLGGIMEEECRQLLQVFFSERRS